MIFLSGSASMRTFFITAPMTPPAGQKGVVGVNSTFISSSFISTFSGVTIPISVTGIGCSGSKTLPMIFINCSLSTIFNRLLISTGWES